MRKNIYPAALVAFICCGLSLFAYAEDVMPVQPAAVAAAEPASAAPVLTSEVSRDPQVPAAGKLNLNVNYPGAALRYFVADGKGLELFGQGQDHIFTGGLRYYSYPASLSNGVFLPYVAAEAEYIKFKGSYAKGNGWGGGLYAGTEYRLSRAFSLQADLGALYVSVKDKDTSLLQSGLEFVINLGFNIYFAGGKP
jgi:hypothetical protein